MLSESLKERLAQYKILKEEEKLSAAPSLSLTRPEDGTLQSSTVVDPTPQDRTSDVAEQGIESGSSVAVSSPDNGLSVKEEFSNSQVSKEVMIFANEIELSEHEFHSKERKEDIEECHLNGDNNSSSKEDDTKPYRNESDMNQGDCDPDQDIFKALDEAERADDILSYNKKGVSRPDTVSQNDEKNFMKDGSKNKCIICGVIFLACVAIVSIVLPFYLDYPSGSGIDSSINGSEDNSDSTTNEVIDPERSRLPSSPTGAPTGVPTKQQWAQFLTTFLIPVSGKEIFQDESSPQYRAAKFILDDPYTATISTMERLRDRYASATFYFATQGDNWKYCYFGDEDCNSGQWLVDDVCDWHAVSCDDMNRVTSFIFANAEGNNLVGTLPVEMKLLSKMVDLVIVNNKIRGTLPVAFGENAESLRSLLLPDNDLTGRIPENYLSNSPLEFVHLGNNALSGPIPRNIGNTMYLRQIDLSGNSITGTILEEIGGFKSLEALSLADNKLQGSVPIEIYNMTSLKFLHLNGNKLTGTISSSIGGLSSLKELRLGGSELSGYIPDELYSLTNLVEIDISQANFVGRISLGFLNLKNLEKLVVSDNELGGIIPSSLGRLSTLSDLNLQGNNFFGAIPESVCLLREDKLEVLTADCNDLLCNCCTMCF